MERKLFIAAAIAAVCVVLVLAGCVQQESSASSSAVDSSASSSAASDASVGSNVESSASASPSADSGSSLSDVETLDGQGGVEVYLDESLKRFQEVFPACGSGASAVRLSIPELEELSGYLQWIDVTTYE